MKTVLDKYNNKIIQSAAGLTPNDAHKDENSIKVKANSVIKEKYLRNYPNIKAGDDVRVFVKRKLGSPQNKTGVDMYGNLALHFQGKGQPLRVCNFWRGRLRQWP